MPILKNVIYVLIGVRMKAIYNKSKNYKEAEQKEILQNINMMSEQRQLATHELRIRVYGKNVLDVRDYYIYK